MANRPLLNPVLRLIVVTPRSVTNISPSEEDTMEAEADALMRENSIGVGQVTLSITPSNSRPDNLIFNLDISTTDFKDFNKARLAVERAVENELGITLDEDDIMVDAEIMKVFNLS